MSDPFKVQVSEPFIAVDAKNSILIVQEEKFYNDAGHCAYVQYVVLQDNPNREEVFKILLRDPGILRVSTAKIMTFDGRETRRHLPFNDDIRDFLDEYSSPRGRKV